MNWYAAHLVLYVKYKEHSQDHFPFWENIVLIQADTDDEAFAKAERRGREDEGDDSGSFAAAGCGGASRGGRMRALFTCVPSYGHFLPLTPIARVARDDRQERGPPCDGPAPSAASFTRPQPPELKPAEPSTTAVAALNGWSAPGRAGPLDGHGRTAGMASKTGAATSVMKSQ